MHLEGSCHCRAVRFRLESEHPYPFNLCYCSICRKTSGGGGFAINISGDHDTLEVEGREHLRVYRAMIKVRDETGEALQPSQGQRHFCGECGSPLWMWDPRWPDLVHPLASAIDTQLPIPPERTHLLVGSRASWVVPEAAERDQVFERFPRESIADWHARLGLEARS